MSPRPAPTATGPPAAPKAATPVSRKGPLPAVPKARRRAAELNVSLEDVRATGPGGVITVEDVELAGGGRLVRPQRCTHPPAASVPAAARRRRPAGWRPRPAPARAAAAAGAASDR